MPVIETDDFEIVLNFELSVDVTWNRFSSSIWDVITGFGGSVSSAWHTFTSVSYSLKRSCFKFYCSTCPMEILCSGEQWSNLAVDFNACSPRLPGKFFLSFNGHYLV